MTKFKEGDQVRCVKSNGTSLHKDKLYTVSKVSKDQPPLLKVNDIAQCFNSGRFELMPNPTVFAPPLSMNLPGAKDDSGKLLPNLVFGDFSTALTKVAEIGTKGAVKYTPHGWLSVPNGVERYKEAMMRHWLDAANGIELDKDSGQQVWAHIAWNALAVLELMNKSDED